MKILLVLFLLESVTNSLATAEDNVLDMSSCGVNKQAKQLAQLIINSKHQQREELTCDKQLANIAYLKAQELAKADKIQHNIDNITPNEFVTQRGIKLPAVYLVLGNQVEAIQGGTKTAKQAYDSFLNSEQHKAHLLGENEFYKQQTHMGVGFFFDKNKQYEYYWVVYVTSLYSDKKEVQKPLKPNTNVVIKFVKPPRKRFKAGDNVRYTKPYKKTKY